VGLGLGSELEIGFDLALGLGLELHLAWYHTAQLADDSTVTVCPAWHEVAQHNPAGQSDFCAHVQRKQQVSHMAERVIGV